MLYMIFIRSLSLGKVWSGCGLYLLVSKIGVVWIIPQKEVGNIAVETNLFQFKMPKIFSVLITVFTSDVGTLQ